MKIQLEITTLGGMGDGIGYHEGQAVFVPFTCIGDKVEVEIEQSGKDFSRAKLVKIIEPGSDRQTPPCQHFMQCGGCSLQHLKPDSYNNFKRDILVQVVRRLGCDESILRPLVEVGQGSRRRAEFKVSVNKGEVSIGFFGAKSHNVIDLAMCPVTSEKITSLLPPLKSLISSLKKPGNIKAINISQSDNGLDIVLNVGSPTAAADKQKLTEFAGKYNILRMAEKTEQEMDVIYGNIAPIINFGTINVELPVGSFLQATHTGQMAITDIILEHTKGYKRVADLYCGCGTYSLPLAQNGHIVHAYEGGHEMVTAIHNAARKSNFEDKIIAHFRDLYKRPLKQHELKNFDALVINPPRNGAKPQADEIAQSDIKKVIMVSCNPATFERDASSLIHGGYKLTQATPIDQFYWNSHLELVAVFEKK
jgi:23S rRNA (uracil1939-C5)-methyltransferase